MAMEVAPLTGGLTWLLGWLCGRVLMCRSGCGLGSVWVQGKPAESERYWVLGYFRSGLCGASPVPIGSGSWRGRRAAPAHAAGLLTWTALTGGYLWAVMGTSCKKSS